MLKFLIVVLLIGILVSLFSSFFFLIKDKGQSQRTLNGLMIRVGLSIALAIVVGLALWTGALSMNPSPLNW